MFNGKFLEELFKPQEVVNKGALKALFQDLAHASIMRLNETSMSKLYDLMSMVFKWQVFSCSHPKELVLITLNHLDGMRAAASLPQIHKQLDAAYFMFIKTYGQMSCGELQRIRYCILNFLQDVRVRVSLLLRQGLQNPDGSFVISPNRTLFYGSELPGKIRLFSKDGLPVDLISFHPGGIFTVDSQPGSTELRGVRRTILGSNIYSTRQMERTRKEEYYEGEDGLRREIDLLVTQLGQDNAKLPDENFSLQLFETNLSPSSISHMGREEATCRREVEPDNPHREALARILAEMQPPSHQTQFDLIDLMDQFP